MQNPMNQPGLKISSILIPLIIEVVLIWQGSLVGSGGFYVLIFLFLLQVPFLFHRWRQRLSIKGNKPHDHHNGLAIFLTLPSSSAMLYYVIDVQLFLQAQFVPHRKHYVLVCSMLNCFFNSNTCSPGTRTSLTHSLTQRLIYDIQENILGQLQGLHCRYKCRVVCRSSVIGI